MSSTRRPSVRPQDGGMASAEPRFWTPELLAAAEELRQLAQRLVSAQVPGGVVG